MSIAPVWFISHGAPDLVLRDQPATHFLKNLRLGDLKGLVVISAHWFTRSELQINVEPNPALMYDFYGFPEPLYHIRWPASSPLWLQEAVSDQLLLAGLPADPVRRELDHGVWSPLSLMDPASSVPLVQLSIPASFTPRQLWQLWQLAAKITGRALRGRWNPTPMTITCARCSWRSAPPARTNPSSCMTAGMAAASTWEALQQLRTQGIGILASGAITHNLRALGPDNSPVPGWARSFVNWLELTMSEGDRTALEDYRARAPGAVESHPHDDHLRPLFVALGAAGQDKPVKLHDSWDGGSLYMGSYRFG
ncbi:DODA-type extradiol aromatic ring-opening family dioxygenase [Aeromonas hydrophila]